MTTCASELTDAIWFHDTQRLQNALTKPDEEKNIPEAYVMALKQNSLECLAILANLVTLGSLNQLECNDWGPLFWAVVNNNIQAVAFLLDIGININAVHDGQSVLHVAIQNLCDHDMIKLLLNHRPNLETEDENGMTPAKFALICRRFDIFVQLADHGASYSMDEVQKIFRLGIHQRDRKTIMTLIECIEDHHLFIDELLRREFEPEVVRCFIKMNEDQRQIFLLDAIRADISIRLMKTLLDRKGHLTDMMLLTAVKYRSNTFVGFLLAMGQEPIQDALTIAVRKHRKDVVITLLNHGARPTSEMLDMTSGRIKKLLKRRL